MVGAWRPEGDVDGDTIELRVLGETDTVAKQIKVFHDRCGVGVIDLPVQQNTVDHRGVMKELEVFRKNVIPQIREF